MVLVEKRKSKLWRYEKTERQAAVYPWGVKATLDRECYCELNSNREPPSPRGKITTFSKAARRRMRECLLRQSIRDCAAFLGVTFTMPGGDFPANQGGAVCWPSAQPARRQLAICKKGNHVGPRSKNKFRGSCVGSPSGANCLPESRSGRRRAKVPRGNSNSAPPGCLMMFQKAVNIFRNRFVRSFPHSSAVFRVELQQRGVPHLHIVFQLSKADLKEFAPLHLLIEISKRHLSDDWCHSACLSGWPIDGDSGLTAFFEHGVKFSDIATRATAIRYLCDHASKAKQAQLGYQGKQWGIWGRRNLELVPPSEVLAGRVAIALSRAFGGLRRYRLEDPRCPFGSRLTRRRSCSQGISYAHPSTIGRLVAWAKQQEQAPEGGL